MEVLSPYEANVDGKKRRYLFPKWTWKNGEYVRINTDSSIELDTGVGRSIIHDELYNTVGYRTDGNHEKFVGLRPGRYQSGDYQVEFSIRSACINETDVPLVTNNPRRIDKHHVSLGNVIVENHRGWHRQMIEVPDTVASVDDFCVEYEILLKGYHLPDTTETTRVIRPTCGFFELGSVEELSTFNSLSVCIFDDSVANNVVYIRGNKWEDVISHNSYFQQFVMRFASESQRVIDERASRDALVSANGAITFSEGLHKSTFNNSSIGLIGCEWIDEYTFCYDVRDINYDLNTLRSIVESVSEISDSTVGELRFIPDDELRDLSEYVISEPVVMDKRFVSLNTGNYHTLKRVDNRWIYTKYAGWGYIISDVREKVKYVDLTINSHNFYDDTNPYSVDSQDDVEAMMAIGTTTTSDWHKQHYVMENDIDMSGATTSPIWQNTTGDGFRGTFNGNGYAIKNLTIISNSGGVGLFGYISGEGGAGIVRNLTISGNCSIHGDCGTGTVGVGVFAGYVDGRTAAFENCVLSMYGDLSQTKDSDNCGGFIGYIYGACKIRNCVSMMTGNIMGGDNIGGFVGKWFGHSTYTPSTEPENSLIENCTQSMLGNIVTYYKAGQSAGGFIGITDNHYQGYRIGTIKNSILSMCGDIYAHVHAGGFIGRSTEDHNVGSGGKWIINACRQEMHGNIGSCRSSNGGSGGFVGLGRILIYNSLLLMKGDIYSEAYIGGFVGGGCHIYIRNSINAMVGNIWSSHPFAGWARAGGFVGIHGNDSNGLQITNCIQMMIGFITAYNSATFVGYIDGSNPILTNCMQIGRIYSRAPTMAAWEGSSYVETAGDLPWTYSENNDDIPSITGSVKFLPCSNTYYSLTTSTGNKKPTKQGSVITDLTNYLTAGWDKTNKINGIFPRLLYNQSIPSTTNGNSYSYILPNVVPMLGSSSNFVPKQDFYRVVHGAKYCKFTNRSMGSADTEPANTSCDGYLFKSKNWTPTHCEYIAATENGNSTSSNYLKMKKILISPGNIAQYSTSSNSYVLDGREGKALPYGAGIWADSFSVNTPSTQSDTIDFPPFINGKRAYMGWSTFTTNFTKILCESTDPKIINDAWDWIEDYYPNNVIQDNAYDVHYIWGWKTSLYRDEGEYNFASRQYAVHNVSKVRVWKHENIEPGQDEATDDFGKGGLNLAEVRLFDASGTNVALRKDAYSLSELGLADSYFPPQISSTATVNSSATNVTLSNTTNANAKYLLKATTRKKYTNTTYLKWNDYTSDQKYEIINEFIRNWKAGNNSFFFAYTSSVNITAVAVKELDNTSDASSNSFQIRGYSNVVDNFDNSYGTNLVYNGKIYAGSQVNASDYVSTNYFSGDGEGDLIEFFASHELYPNINIPHARWFIGTGSNEGAGEDDPNNIINGTTQLVHDSYGGTANVYASTAHSAYSGISTQCGGIEISLNGAYDINRIEIVHRSNQEVRVNGLKFQFIDADGNNISAADFMIPDNAIHQGDSNTTFNPRHKSLELYPAMNDGPFVLSETAFDYTRFLNVGGVTDTSEISKKGAEVVRAAPIDYDKRVLLITPDEKLPKITFSTPNLAWNAPYTIMIGSNEDGALTKSALLPYEGMTVSPVPVDSSHPRFKVDVYGNLLTVRREGHCERPKYYYEFRGNYSSPITDEIGGSLQVTANTVSGTNISFGHDGAYFSNDTAVGYSVSYLNFPDVTLPASNNGSLSLEFYIKHESFGGGNWSRVFDFQDADYTGDATIAFFKSSTDDFVFMIRTENNDGNGSSDSQIYHEDVQTGVWYHYVLTISKNSGNNSTMKMYVDGKLNSSKTDAIVLPSLQRVNHYFSRSAWWPAQGATEPNIGGFDGWLAYFRIWDDTALSADEVKTLYEDRLFPRVGSSAWTENGIGWTQDVEFNAIKSNGYVGGRLIKQRYNGYFGVNSSGPKNTLDTANQYGNGSVDKLPHGEDGNNTNSGSDVVFSNPVNSAIAEGSIDFSLNAEDYFSYKWTGFFQPPMTDNFVATRSSSSHSGVIHEVCAHSGNYNSNPAALYNFKTTSDDASYMLMFGPEGRRSSVGDAKVSIDIDYSPVIHGGQHGSSSRESSQLTSANGRYTSSSNDPSYREGSGLMLWKYVRYPVQILFGEWTGGETMKFEWKGPATTIVNSQISMGYPSNLSNGSYTTNLSAAFHCETWEQIAVSNHFILGDNMRDNDVPTAERGLRLRYYNGNPPQQSTGSGTFTPNLARAWFNHNTVKEKNERIVGSASTSNSNLTNTTGIDLTDTTSTWSAVGINELDYFSLKITGFFRAPSTSIFSFQTTSDDYSLLYVDNRLIVNNSDNDGGQGSTTVSGTISMTKGKHYPIELLYGEGSGSNILKFEWKGGSQTSYTTSLNGGQFYYSGVVLDDKKTIQNLGTARYRAEQELFNATSTVLGFVGSLDDDSHTVTKVRVLTTAAESTNLMELQVWVGNTNIALSSNNATVQTGNLASGTHNLSHSLYSRTNLIDNNTSTMYHQHNTAADEYIEVVFDSSFNISELQEIVVINRASNLARYDSTKIQLYNGTTLVTSYDNNDGITSPEVIIYRQSYSSSAESWRSSNSLDAEDSDLKIIKMAPVSNDSSYGYNRIETDHQVYHDASWNYQVGKNTIMHDTSAPTITITGSSTVTLTLNSKYTINRATATDTYDRTVPISITSNKAIDTGIDGSSYLVTYTAVDSSNNISTATRTINIGNEAADTTAPVITLNGSSSVTVEVCNASGAVYDDPGIVAVDAVDGTLSLSGSTPGWSTNSSTSVTMGTVGTYTVTYTATDTAGNSSTATRTVIVSDTTPPTITLCGANSISIDISNIVDERATNYNRWKYFEAPHTGTYRAYYPEISQYVSNVNNSASPPTITLSGITDSTSPVYSSKYGGTFDWIWQQTYTTSGGYSAWSTYTESEKQDIINDFCVKIGDGTYNIGGTVSAKRARFSIIAVREHSTALFNIWAYANGVNTWHDTMTYGRIIMYNNYTYERTSSATATGISAINTTWNRETSTIYDIYLVNPDNGTSWWPKQLYYNDPGIVATDNYNSDLSQVVSGRLTTGVSGWTSNSTLITMNKPGTYTVTYTANDATGNSSTTSRTVVINPDNEPPTITITAGYGTATSYVLNGGNTSASTSNFSVSIARTSANTYTEQGATATDSIDGSVDVTTTIVNSSGNEVESVDNSTEETYTITYTANDANGNQRVRQKIVTIVDNSLPIITINAGYGTADRVSGWDGTASTANVTITLNQSTSNEYIEKGITVTDEGPDGVPESLSYTDANVVITTNKTVTTANVGSYLITYTAEDIAGNESSRTKLIHVVDKIGPVITLNGTSTTYVLLCSATGAVYDDPGIVAKDYAGPGMTLSEELSKGSNPGWVTDSATSVDMDVNGEYTVTYTATDQYGNQTTATRSVTVSSDGIPADIKIRKDSIRSVFNTVCQAYVKFDENANLITYTREDVAGFKLQNNGRFGVGKDDPTALFHASACRFEDDFTVDSIILSDSDKRLKIKIEDITVPEAGKIHELEPMQYNWKVNPDGSVHFGFIAQDIVNHYPDLVKIDNEGGYSLDYIGFIPLIIKELKRQMSEIDDLTQESAHLKKLLEAELKKYNDMNKG